MSVLSVVPDSPVDHACARPEEFSCSASWASGGLDDVWVRVTGELDLATTPQLQRMLADPGVQAQLIVLDLSKLTFLDSTGVHAIVDATLYARSHGRRLVTLCGPEAERTLTLTARRGQIETPSDTLSGAAAGLSF